MSTLHVYFKADVDGDETELEEVAAKAHDLQAALVKASCRRNGVAETVIVIDQPRPAD